jgi:hypothetical protein
VVHFYSGEWCNFAPALTAGEWPREQFRKRGVEYWPAGKPKSDLYLSLAPPINSGRVDLLDSDRLTAQLCGLERRTARGGRDSIDHPPGGHDDLANAVAGAIHMTLTARRRRAVSFFPPRIVSAGPERIDLNRDPELRTFHDYAIR